MGIHVVFSFREFLFLILTSTVRGCERRNRLALLRLPRDTRCTSSRKDDDDDENEEDDVVDDDDNDELMVME